MNCQFPRQWRLSSLSAAAVCIATAYLSSGTSLGISRAEHETASRKTRIVAAQSFCGSLAKSIAGVLGETYRIETEISASHLLALQNRLLTELTQESGASFIDIAAMTPEQPEGQIRNSATANGETVLPLARILGPAMGLGKHVLLAYSFDELKFLPFTQMGSQILLITADSSAFAGKKFAEERLNLVRDTAKKLNVKISLLNIKNPKSNATLTDALADMASNTGGTVVEIDGTANGCGKLL